MDISSMNNMANSYMFETKKTSETKDYQETVNIAKQEGDDESLKEVCQEFEAYFIQQLFKEMKNTVPDGGLIGKSQGEDIFEEMLYEEYAKEASKGMGIGITDIMYQQLSTVNQGIINKINTNG